ncbi:MULTISPECIES: hypothetical protein [unclassified Amycolatopsis]|uniref:hypothetical protein n=1 Tax=unclassified Amycolatopsis TaxID=2618356 RepID=UPI001F0F96D6|nr:MULTISPECIES: hypothetical protein [unclassified Amycolatopsis]
MSNQVPPWVTLALGVLAIVGPITGAWLGGALKVVEKTDTIRDWLDWLERPKSGGGRGLMAPYRAILFDTVSAIFQAAVDDKKIRTNPCRAKSIKRPQPVQRKVVPWGGCGQQSVHTPQGWPGRPGRIRDGLTTA